MDGIESGLRHPNVPGSNNDTVPWFGAATMSAEQAAEVTARDAANLLWLEKAFATAEANGAKGVVLIFQADMWGLLRDCRNAQRLQRTR